MKWHIPVLGSLSYWIFSLLLHKIFENIEQPFRFLETLFTAIIGPFILGIIVALITKNRKGWLYGGVCYLIYFIWANIFGWAFKLHFSETTNHLLNVAKVFLYLGLIATLLAALGGFLSDYIKRRWLS